MKDLTTQFDWLEFTVKGVTSEQVIHDLLGLQLGDFNRLKRGRFGYNTQFKWDQGHLYVLFNTTGETDSDGQLLENPDDSMGIHVLLTGTGCTAYGNIRSIHSLIMFVIGGVKDHNFSRIDLAVDDKRESLLAFSRIYQHACEGSYTSRWSKWDEVMSHRSTNNEFIGRTMYFGSQRSDIFCRIYDKALEQRRAHPDDKDIPEEWTRMEIVYKKERANLLAEHLTKTALIGTVIRETLNNYLRFTELGTDSNKSRWKTAAWWNTFIAEAGKLQLTVPKSERSIEDMKDWVEKQISPTLAAIVTAHDGEVTWFYKMLSGGKNRLKRKHLDAISKYAKELSEQYPSTISWPMFPTGSRIHLPTFRNYTSSV